MYIFLLISKIVFENFYGVSNFRLFDKSLIFSKTQKCLISITIFAINTPGTIKQYRFETNREFLSGW